MDKTVELVYVHQPIITAYVSKETLTKEDLLMLGNEMIKLVDENPILQERLQELIDFYHK